MEFTTNQKIVSEYYIASLGRVPEKDGLDYWIGRLEGTIESESKLKIEEIRDYFLDRTIAEVLERFPIGQDSVNVVDNIYKNVFGRDADSEGLNYWVQRIDGINEAGQEQLSENELISEMLVVAKSVGNEVDGEYLSLSLENAENNYFNTSNIDKSIYSKTNNSLGDLSTSATYGVSTLDSNIHWEDDLNITYSFNTNIPIDYYNYYDSEKLIEGWETLNENQKYTISSIIEKLDELLAITFEEVPSNGLIQFNLVDMDENTAGFAFVPGKISSYEGDVFFNTDFNTEENYGLEEGEEGYLTMIHELGHAMGLKHPFECGETLPLTLDDTNHSVMSYTTTNNYIPILSFSSTKIYMDYIEVLPSFYSLYDVAALQSIYGANTTTNTQNNIYTLKYTDYKIQTIWDAGGIDTIDLSNTIGDSNIDLRGGTINSADQYTLDNVIKINQDISTANGKSQHNNWIADNLTDLYNDDNLYTGIDNLGIATGTIIENIITGSGDDTITDNEVDNIIETSFGDDKFYLGNGGSDYVDGGDGNDIVYLNNSLNELNIVYLEDDYYITTSNYMVQLRDVEQLFLNDNILYNLDSLIV